MRLENAMRAVGNERAVVVLHYAPIVDTIEGEPLEIFPFLGSSRLSETIDRFKVSAVVHGHAHHGRYEGHTPVARRFTTWHSRLRNRPAVPMHGTLANLRHERFAQALARGKTATEAYVLAGYKANDGNASRMKGNERISARVHEIVGRAAERAEVDVERILRELAAIAFSRIGKPVTWGPSVQVREEEEDGQRVKVIVSAVLRVPSDKLDENTAAAIASVSAGPAGAVRISMHNKLAALVALVSTSECSTSARRTLMPFMPSLTSR